jgi:hypothetical protein
LQFARAMNIAILHNSIAMLPAMERRTVVVVSLYFNSIQLVLYIPYILINISTKTNSSQFLGSPQIHSKNLDRYYSIGRALSLDVLIRLLMCVVNLLCCIMPRVLQGGRLHPRKNYMILE